MRNFSRFIAIVLILCLLPVVNVFAESGSISVEFSNRVSRNAGGIITVNLANDDVIRFFWGDENGEKLTGYTYLGYVATEGGIGEFEIQRYTYIPEGARQILAFGDSNGEKIASYEIPEYKLGDMPEKSYSFGALTDPHVGHSTYPNSEGDFERAYNKLGEYGVSLIGNDGDISSYNLINDWSLYNRKVNAFNEKYPNVACFAVSGNHDASHNDFDKANWNKYIRDEIVNYKGYTQAEFYDGNDLDFIYRIENDVFIFFNATNWKDTAHTIDYYSHEQLDWLEKRLEENKDRRCFLFMHYGPFKAHAIEKNDGTLAGGTFENGDYMDVLFTKLYKKYPNVMAFFGHSHRGLNYQLAQYVKGSVYANTMNHNINDIDGGATVVHIPSLTEPSYYYYNEEKGTAAASSDANHLSEGYIVDVYDDCVVLKGYDFVKNEIIAYATYIVGVKGLQNDVEVSDRLLFDKENKTITVKGTATDKNELSKAVMIMTTKGADIENLTKDEILYYNQQNLSRDGSYCFNFKISPEIDENEFDVYINIDGENMTKTISETVVDWAWADAGIQLVRESYDNLKAVYTVRNYNKAPQNCDLLFGFYDDMGVLVSAKTVTKAMPEGTESERIELDIPENANSVAAYVWNSGGMVPLCKAVKVEI